MLKICFNTVCVFLIGSTSILYAQSGEVKFTDQNFSTEILNYHPLKRATVTDDNFKKGNFYLEETRNHAKGDPKSLDEVDFWNITMAFVKLKEPKENISISFRKAIATNPGKICEYVHMLGNSNLDQMIPELFNEFLSNCAKQTKLSSVDQATYPKESGLNNELVSLMDKITQQDTKFRNSKMVDWSKQSPLDLDNQKKIDSLFKIYKKYIGKTMVGKELQGAMWLVIQHSNLAMMENYLPIIHQAVKNDELGQTNLKMLIDRIYTLKFNYQLFASQVGVPMADEEIRKKVAKKYGIN